MLVLDSLKQGRIDNGNSSEASCHITFSSGGCIGIYPTRTYGISDIDIIADLIDIDEAGIFLETVNRKYGKAYTGNLSSGTRRSVQRVPPYGYSTKWTLNSSGPVFYKKLARQFWTLPTLSRESWTASFAETLIAVDASSIMDNEPVVTHECMHTCLHPADCQCCRSPDCFPRTILPVDGPIEFVFNTTEQAHPHQPQQGYAPQPNQTLCSSKDTDAAPPKGP
jgi:hypothetical protein